MSPFVLAGLILAVMSVGCYLAAAFYKKKRPELNDAVVVFLGAGGVVSAVRIIGAVFTGQFSQLTVTTQAKSIWTLVPDDAVQIVLGGFALAWVSIETILQSFGNIENASRRQLANGNVSGQIDPDTTD